MPRMSFLIFCLATALLVSVEGSADTGDLSSVIERFMAKQFPVAQSHFWVVNGTQWQAENELVLDVNTIVVDRGDHAPTENRFLLLVVAGELAAAQNIPLDAETNCQPEQA